MKTLEKIQRFILPREIDFFNRLEEQSNLTKNIINELYCIYVEKTSEPSSILKNLIENAEERRRKNLQELYTVFITPVDNEAISRAYFNLDWVVMSVKHLEVELEIYGIKDLPDFKTILTLIKEEMNKICEGFGMLHKIEVEAFSKIIFDVVHHDNLVIKEYARLVSALFTTNDIKRIITQKELLNQVKEISKRIRICANDLEDLLFKMK